MHLSVRYYLTCLTSSQSPQSYLVGKVHRLWMQCCINRYKSKSSNSHYLEQNPHQGQQQKRQSCLLPVESCYGTIIVTSYCIIVTSGHHGSSIRTHLYQTIELPRKLPTGSIHDLFCYCPLVSILFEVLKIDLTLYHIGNN